MDQASWLRPFCLMLRLQGSGAHVPEGRVWLRHLWLLKLRQPSCMGSLSVPFGQ